MRVKVQLFARLRELAGRADWSCDVPPGATVADVWNELARAFPAVSPMARAVSSAVNAEFATSTRQIGDGDEVAFLPPVSGGAGADNGS